MIKWTEWGGDDPLSRLTPREREVLGLYAKDGDRHRGALAVLAYPRS
ncbi:hypothetical protein [Streptosporangium sp. NPDC006007]